MGEVLEIVEIDVGMCTRVYGSSPCTASLSAINPRKCFNTRKTCQDLANISGVDTTLRFSRPVSGLPKGETIFPAVTDISRQSAGINIAGRTQGPLGTRARLTVKFKDFAYHDRLTDKYAEERKTGAASFTGETYNPVERGTFFAKLFARWPHYDGAAFRLRIGEVGDDIAGMSTRNYVIDTVSGPDKNGNVTVSGTDILGLAKNENAKCPAPSGAALAGAVGLDLTPFIITDTTDFPASGRLLIGSEIMTYTRSGATVTPTGRAIDGSTMAAHSIGDAVQPCVRYNINTIDIVLRDMLEGYAGIDPSFIPATDWANEIARWMPYHKITRTIPKPTGVETLVAELLRLGVMIWWDDEAQLIRLRVNRHADINETVHTISDAKNIIEDSASPQRMTDQRASAVIAYYGISDAASSATSSENYDKAVSPVSSAGFSKDQFYTILLPFLDVDAATLVAREIAYRHLLRFQYPPRRVNFQVDHKDRSKVKIGALVSLESWSAQDETGASAPLLCQVMKSSDAVSGHLVAVTVEETSFLLNNGFYAEDGRGDYSVATDAEKEKGTYFVDETTLAFPDGRGAYGYF